MKQLIHFLVLCTLYLVLPLTIRAQESEPVADGPHKASRSTVLANAKNLKITTTANKSYYYVVSAEEKPMLHLDQQGIVRIGQDEFAMSNIKTMRFLSMPRLYLDEDSTVHGSDYAVDHALLALRRSFRLGGWNTLMLPFGLTGTQVRYIFGEDAQLARARGAEEEDIISVEFDLIDLDTDDEVLSANLCYLIRPTRDPDVAEGKSISSIISGTRLYGPIYLLPNVTMKSGMSPNITYIRRSSDNSTVVRMRGTYIRLDNSVRRSATNIVNKKLTAGTWSFNDEGYIVENTDSTMLQAFRCWFQNMTDKQLRFYINGVQDDLNGTATGLISALVEPRTQGGDVFDLQGRRVATLKDDERPETLGLPRGIYIINGKKVFIK